MTQDDVRTVDFRENGKVFLTGVKRPTFLYDRSSGIRHKYGEFEQVETIYNSWREGYMVAGNLSVADDLGLVEVEPSQELVDELFQSSGRFAIFVRAIDQN